MRLDRPTPGLRRPMEADGSVENAVAFPTAPWTAPKAPTHSSHRPGYEQLESKVLNCPRKRVNSSTELLVAANAREEIG